MGEMRASRLPTTVTKVCQFSGLCCLCLLYVSEFVSRECGHDLHPFLDGDAPVFLTLCPGSVSADRINRQVIQSRVVAVGLESAPACVVGLNAIIS